MGRSKGLERVVFTCDCGGAHYFEIWKWSDDGQLDWSICFVERPIGFKQKLAKIWQVLRGQDVFDAEIYPDDIQHFATAVSDLVSKNSKPARTHTKSAPSTPKKQEGE